MTRINRSYITAGLAVFVFLPGNGRAASASSNMVDSFKKSIVILGRESTKGHASPEERISLVGTGVILGVKNRFFILTAKHNVFDKESGDFIDEDMVVGHNTKDGNTEIRRISEIKKSLDVQWITHKSTDVDLALLPFSISPDYDDLMVIPENFFAQTDTLEQLYDVFFLGYLPEVLTQPHFDPVVRSGMISRVNRDKTVTIEAYSFPGNSGGPVFLMPTPSRDHVNIDMADPLKFQFIGIIGDYIPYRDIAASRQSGRARVEFEDNTGLTKVWTMKYTDEIIASPKFQAILNRPLK